MKSQSEITKLRDQIPVTDQELAEMMDFYRLPYQRMSNGNLYFPWGSLKAIADKLLEKLEEEDNGNRER